MPPEMLLDATVVERPRLIEALSALLREDDERAAAVVGAGFAFDEACGGDAIDEAREAGTAEEHGARQVVHAQAAAGVPELDKDVVPDQRQPEVAAEFVFEDLGQARMRTEEGTPRLEVRLIEFLDLAGACHTEVIVGVECNACNRKVAGAQ